VIPEIITSDDGELTVRCREGAIIFSEAGKSGLWWVFAYSPGAEVVGRFPLGRRGKPSVQDAARVSGWLNAEAEKMESRAAVIRSLAEDLGAVEVDS